MAAKTVAALLGLLAAIGSNAQQSQQFTTPYGITDVTKPFHLYAVDEYGNPYSITLARSSGAVVARAYDFVYNKTAVPAPTTFTLGAPDDYFYTIKAKFEGKPVSSVTPEQDYPDSAVALTFGPGSNNYGTFQVYGRYRPAALRRNDQYIDVVLENYNQGAGFAFSQIKVSSLCTTKDGGYLAFGYGQNPGKDPNSLLKKPCRGAILNAFPGDVRPPNVVGP